MGLDALYEEKERKNFKKKIQFFQLRVSDCLAMSKSADAAAPEAPQPESVSESLDLLRLTSGCHRCESQTYEQLV
jgi:hypothetical protein